MSSPLPELVDHIASPHGMTFEEWYASKLKTDSYFAQWGETIQAVNMKVAARAGWEAANRQQPEEKAMTVLQGAAMAMVASYQDHVDRCRVCTVNWQNLKAALASFEPQTRTE